MEETDYPHLANPYEVSLAYLPLDANVPDATGERLPAEIKRLLADIVFSAQSLTTKLRTQLLETSDLRTGLLELSCQFAAARQFLIELPEVKHFISMFNYETGRLATQKGYSQLTEEQHLGYIIYDRYFEVVRVEQMTFLSFTAQVIFTGEAVLDDLSVALLEMDEFTFLIEALYRIILTLVSELEKSTITTTVWENISNTSDLSELPFFDTAPQLTGLASPDYSQQKALYRWKIGHHFFDLCAIFGRRSLKEVHSALCNPVQPDWEKAATDLQAATIFWRGTTAAMWYASNFPAHIYSSIIRPSMVSTRMPNGFSGDQNLDYARLKEAKDELKALLQVHPALLAHPVFQQALSAFIHIYVLDNESHTLLAAARVGNDTSLVQKEWQAELDMAQLTHRFSAVDVLRQMTELRRQEFAFVLGAKSENESENAKGQPA